jgi:hypothetical protein
MHRAVYRFSVVIRFDPTLFSYISGRSNVARKRWTFVRDERSTGVSIFTVLVLCTALCGLVRLLLCPCVLTVTAGVLL